MPDLERQLRELAPAIEWPAAPNLAPAVRRRIEAEPARRFARPGRRSLVIAFAVLVVAVGAVMAVPSARTAVLEWLGLRGVTVQRVETLPTVTETVPEQFDELGVGELVTADEATELAGFRLPDAAATPLGEPDEIHYTPAVGNGQVAYIWRDDDGQVETLLTVFRAGIHEAYIQKMVDASGDFEQVEVDGQSGIWVEGLHFFMYVLPSGEGLNENARLSRNALLWEDGDRLYRLEGDLTLEQARTIADDLDP
jgi:hypothetical protein